MHSSYYARGIRLRVAMVVCGPLLGSYTGFIHAVDASPGAYVPAPRGANIAMLQLGGGKAGEFQPNNGRAIRQGTELEAKTGQVRLFHMFDISGQRVQVQLGLPFGSQKLKRNGVEIGKESGMADPYVAVSFWPIDDPINQRYLVITGFLQVPSGSYDKNNPFNMGNNRYGRAIVLGYAQTWGAWRLELNQDVTWYSGNSEANASNAKLEQDPTYNFQPWLSYTFDSKVMASFGVARTWGGESTLDGIDTGRSTDYLRVRAGVGYWLKKNVQIYSELNRDVEVKGGYKFDYSGFVRFAYVF